jgi:hypothetical protein
MKLCGNDYGKTDRQIDRQTDRQAGLFLLTATGSDFAGETHSHICVRPRNPFLEDTELFICPDIVANCTYATDSLQALYCDITEWMLSFTNF